MTDDDLDGELASFQAGLRRDQVQAILDAVYHERHGQPFNVVLVDLQAGLDLIEPGAVVAGQVEAWAQEIADGGWPRV